jgi:hypothetical protein
MRLFKNLYSNGFVVRRGSFFLTLILTLTGCFMIPKMLWLSHARRTKGIFAFAGKGSAGDQVRLDYSVIYFKLEKDTFWFNGLGNIDYSPGDNVPIRYQSDNPSDAKVDLFIAIWGETLVDGGIPMLMLLCIMIHPGVVPRRARLRLGGKKPFIWIV